MNDKTCRECGTTLAADDIAIFYKLITRNTMDFLCIDCLGKELKCGRGPIEDRIRYYKESGNCVLFKS